MTKNRAAVALGRNGGLAGKGKRGAAARTAARARWATGRDPVWQRSLEWTTTRIYAAASGWIVEHDSRLQGDWTGRRVLVPYDDLIPAGHDLSAPWTGGVDCGMMLLERATDPSARVLRRGIQVA